MLGLFAADGAGVAEILLRKGDAAGGHARLLLHLHLALKLTAPHGLDEAALFLLKLFCLLKRMCLEDVLVEILLCLVEQTLLNGLEQLVYLLAYLVERDGDLLAVVTAHGHAHAVFDIAGADLDAQGHALHLVLSALPAEAVVADIDLDTHTGGLYRLVQLGGLLGDAGLMLRNGHDDDLNGRYLGRQDEAVVVAVSHDDAADDTGRHAPRGLMGVLELVVLIGEGDAKLLGKAGAEVVARAGLERLVVVHHALDGVGVDGAGKLLLLGLVAPYDGHCEVIFAHIGVDLKLLAVSYTHLTLPTTSRV